MVLSASGRAGGPHGVRAGEVLHGPGRLRAADGAPARPAGQTDALVASWLPGSEGAGVADVVFGRRPFTGKLPVSWPRAVDQGR